MVAGCEFAAMRKRAKPPVSTIQVGEKCGETELTGPEVETSSACTRSEKRVLVSLCAIDFAPELRHAMSDDVRMLPVADYIVI
eukprot:1173935-Rhodomonas_salina.2